MRSDIPSKVAKVRLDISDRLWHFTRRDGDPAKTLESILASGHIKGGCDVFCAEPCVCLTEMPITEAVRQSEILNRENYNRFSDYGIGFRKSWIFGKGGLPVVYQPNKLKDTLPRTIRWRHCELDYDKGIDFTWQREWRVPTRRLDFTSEDDVIVVAKTEQEAMMIVGGSMYIDDVHDEIYVDFNWTFISHDVLKEAKSHHDIEAMKMRHA